MVKTSDTRLSHIRSRATGRATGSGLSIRRPPTPTGPMAGARLQRDDHLPGGYALHLNVEPSLYGIEALSDNKRIRGGDISALREGPGQEILVNDPADLVIHKSAAEDEPSYGCASFGI